jgi:hypothetical protein
MSQNSKKDELIIKKLLGNRFETHDDVKKELVRRSAVLDFLALYQEARKDEVVDRVKHVVHAEGFLEFKPKHLEVYITRLLGRCLRAHCEGPQVVEKHRNSFGFDVNIRRSHPQFGQILDMQKLVQLGWPWRLSTWYGYGRRHTRNQQYNDDPQRYWRTRGLVDPSAVDSMYGLWNVFKARVDTLERVSMDGRLVVRYGNPGFIGRNRWYKPYSNPSYYAYEAYRDFKEWIRIAEQFLENDSAFDTYKILSDHDQNDDDDIETMLEENAEREAQFLRERALEMARQRSRDNSIDYPPEEEEQGHAPEVEEGTTGETLQNRLLAKLREKGLME